MASHILPWTDQPPEQCRNGALTIGNFDGVHRGHQALLAELRKQARAVGGPGVALTFDPHPLQILRPDRFQPVLTSPAVRAELLEHHGADQVVILNIAGDLLQLTAEDFFHRVICSGFGVRAVVEGPNFGFGRNRQGNIDTLVQLCGESGIAAVVVPRVELDGEQVSSSRVRQALLAGSVREAACLLGRPYSLAGRVGTGRRRGQQLGFPTANLEHIGTLIPGDGVYAVRAAAGNRLFPAAANIGPNPTFGEPARKVEVHLIGFEGDLYGQEIAISFVDRLRDTRPFAGPAELRDQLSRDVQQARHIVEGDSGLLMSRKGES